MFPTPGSSSSEHDGLTLLVESADRAHAARESKAEVAKAQAANERNSTPIHLSDSTDLPLTSVSYSGRELPVELTSDLEQQLRIFKTLSSIIDYAYTFDREGRFLYANQSLLSLLGLELDQIVGKTFLELPYPKDLALRLHAQIQKVFTTRHKLTDETVYISPTGVLGHYEYIFNPVFGADGSVEIVAGSTRDVTERKQAEAALIRSEKLAAAGRLAATLAHEINNPLQAVINLLTILKQSPRLNDQDVANAVMAEEELGRVATLTQQALGFYRESTASSLVDVPAVVGSVIRLYARKAASKRVRIIERYVSREALIESHPGEIRQVFSTLLVNAMEAVPEEGLISISIRRASHLLHPALRGVRITVADNGKGIPPQDLPHVFDAFFTTKGEQGSGLGLWVASGIVSRLGGSLQVRSSTRPGKSGTCFSVFLPG